MINYDYKHIPVPRSILTGKSGKDSHEAAVRAYEEMIRSAAKGGWELDGIDTIVSYQKAGCLAALFGNKKQVVNYKLLVFKKESEGTESENTAVPPFEPNASYQPPEPAQTTNPMKLVIPCVLGIIALIILVNVISNAPPRLARESVMPQTAPATQTQPRSQEPADTRTFARVTMDTNKLLYLGDGKYETLTVRDSPSLSGAKIGALERGTRVEILEEGGDTSVTDASTGQTINGKWARINAPALAGWCFSGYLDKEEE